MKEITRCTRCIMDDASDPTIRFDAEGHCNYCRSALASKKKNYYPGSTDPEQNERLAALLDRIKKQGRGKSYDCIMGLSGGLDSSYLAYLGYQWGLRVLAVHVDDGYDTEISKANLKKLVEATGFDYEVITPDAEQYDALTLAYLRAGVPNICVPQDNILFAFLYQKMKDEGIRYFLSGGNFALESILQRGNSHSAKDLVNLMDIHARFGTKPVDRLRFTSDRAQKLDTLLRGIRSPRPLNLIEYNRDRAFRELAAFCDFQYYGSKHLENVLTAFAQLYWIPKKFGVDKRTSHLSSMIVSGQLTRDAALEALSEPMYNEAMMQAYIAVIRERLGISEEAFEAIMNAPAHQHTDYAVEKMNLFDQGLRVAMKIDKLLHHI